MAGNTPSASAVTALDPLAAAGKKIYGDQSCDACHGESGIGTDAGPKLAGTIAQKPAAEMAQLLRHPNAAMTKGQMPPVEVSDAEMKALVAYIQSLK